MAEHWDTRAQEDCYYYVAYEQRDHGDAFWNSGRDIASYVADCFDKWNPPDPDAQDQPTRALEIGCGPGRLMAHMAERITEVYGVDVSPEMIRQAKTIHSAEKLHFATVSDPTLDMHADESLDLVYSFAVFQHIPNKDIVRSYLSEAFRILRPGGMLAVQVCMRTLDYQPAEATTWAGVIYSRAEMRQLTTELGFRLVTMDGESDQYMWVMAIKPGTHSRVRATPEARILSVPPAVDSEKVLTPWGVASMASMYISGLSVDDCDMNYLRLTIDDQLAETVFFGPADYPGIRQINFVIPPTLTPAGHRIEVVFSSPTSEWQAAIATDIASPPAESLDWLWLSDGREVSRQWHVICDAIKVQVRGIRSPKGVTLETSYGAVLSSSGTIVISERLGWYEMNFDSPEAPTGQHQMRLHHPATGDTEWKTVKIGES
jgi:SAM-dependent methyltransferase